MYLIRTKNKKVNDPVTKFVGVHLPLRIHSCITLYSLATNTNKSTLMESIFIRWIAQIYTAEVEEKCYVDFSKIMFSKYLDLKVTRDKSLPYTFFINEVKKELEYKGLTIPVIKKILEYIDAEHELFKNKR